MKEQYLKQQQKKEPLAVKLNQILLRPSAHQRVAFFAAAASASADKGGYLYGIYPFYRRTKT